MREMGALQGELANRDKKIKDMNKDKENLNKQIKELQAKLKQAHEI